AGVTGFGDLPGPGLRRGRRVYHRGGDCLLLGSECFTRFDDAGHGFPPPRGPGRAARPAVVCEWRPGGRDGLFPKPILSAPFSWPPAQLVVPARSAHNVAGGVGHHSTSRRRQTENTRRG